MEGRSTVTGGIIGAATNTIEAKKIAEQSYQPYIYEVSGGNVVVMVEGEYMIDKDAFICEESYYKN